MDLDQVLAELEDPPAPSRGGNDLHYHGMTLDEIARIEGVTKERIRQIEYSALRKCARWCNQHGYRLGDLIR